MYVFKRWKRVGEWYRHVSILFPFTADPNFLSGLNYIEIETEIATNLEILQWQLSN
jgi:hypothetical protein